jgi:hypothetical protein
MRTNEQVVVDSLRSSLKGKPDTEGVTVSEWTARFQVSDQKARQEIKALLVAGVLIRVRAKRLSLISGSWTPVNAFRPAPAKKGKR